jgi:hypothetical protein
VRSAHRRRRQVDRDLRPGDWLESGRIGYDVGVAVLVLMRKGSLASWIALTATACATSAPPSVLGGAERDKANAYLAAESASVRAVRAAAPMPAGRQEALALIRESQENPLAEDDPRVLGLFKWIEKAPGVKLILCLELVPELDLRNHPRHRLLLRQVTLAQAAYTIEHPDARPSAQPVFAAGLGAGARAYRKLLAAHPEDHHPGWDGIELAERENRLGPLVRKATSSCLGSP